MISIDCDESVYFSVNLSATEAHFEGNPVFDRSGQLVHATGMHTTVFGKLSTDGALEWTQQIHPDSGGMTLHQPEDTGEPPSIYMTGRFFDTVDFDPSLAGVHELTSAGAADVFVAKYDSEGSFLWAQRAGNPESGSTMTFDSSSMLLAADDGNVYISGSFHGTADFGYTYLTSKGVFDGFIAKLDANDGNFLWARRMGGDQEDGQDRANGIAVSASGELYVGGVFYGTADFGQTVITSNGDRDASLSKLNSDGDFLWTKQLGGEYSDSLYYLELDEANHLYLSGRISGAVDFDFGEGYAILSAPTDVLGIFVSKVDSEGEFISARLLGGDGYDNFGMTHVSDGDIYMSGRFAGVGQFDTGTETVTMTASGRADGFLVKTTQDRGAIMGRLFWDNNENGLMAPDELPLAGRTVYLDQNQNGQLDTDEYWTTTGLAGDYVLSHLLADTTYYVAQQTTPGWIETIAPAPIVLNYGQFSTGHDLGSTAVAEVTTYSQSDPKKLGDNRTTISTLPITDSVSILDLNVSIDISHTSVGQLRATLTSPSGTQINLFSEVGGTGDHFTDTVFDDQATIPIEAGTAPFTGRFIPEAPLSALANEDVNGTWSLSIRDLARGERGTLNSWSLEVTHVGSETVNTAPIAVDDLATTNVDVAVMIDLLGNDYDPDGDPIAITSLGTPSNGTLVDHGDGTVTYTPNPGFIGNDQFAYAVSDGDPTTPDAWANVDIAVEELATSIVYDYLGDARTIGDDKVVTTTVTVADSDPIAALQLQLDLTHANMADLTVTLISPNGVEMTVPNSMLVNGANTYDLTFQAGQSAADLQRDGEWTLRIEDSVKNRLRGTLNSWALVVQPAPVASGAPSAVDEAMLAWSDPYDPDEEEESDTLAYELALMLVG